METLTAKPRLHFARIRAGPWAEVSKRTTLVAPLIDGLRDSRPRCRAREAMTRSALSSFVQPFVRTDRLLLSVFVLQPTRVVFVDSRAPRALPVWCVVGEARESGSS